MSAEQDEADVRRVLGGDTSAFEGIVKRWQGPLINLAYRYCRDRGRAEEMAQEAFLRSYKSLAIWRKDAVFSTWLFAIAANVYRSELKRTPWATESLDPHTQIADLRGASRESESQQGSAVCNAVQSLPLNYREVLTLFYFHEMDVAATAKSLRLPDGTVKARLSRGREMLRKKLGYLWTSSQTGETSS